MAKTLKVNYQLDPKDAETKEWNELLIMSIVCNTIESMERRGLVTTQKDPSNSSIKKIEGYLSATYDFKYNPVLSRVEYKVKDQAIYSLVGGRELNSLYRELNLAGIKCQVNGLKTVLESNYVVSVDPFAEYFKNLPVWDGETDFIDQLASTVTTTNQDFWKHAFKKWIIAVVACAIYPDKTNHEVLVLSGIQGKGKTTWLESLLPESLKGYMYNGTIDPANKDTAIQLSETFLINLDELENLNKSELGTLKSLITQKTIRVRRPFGYFNENYVRRASFMGSVNDAEFLSDSTGNRRYLCFSVTNINGEGRQQISIDDVFGQAYNILVNGTEDGPFKYWFDEEDILQLNENNEAFVRRSPEEEYILKYFSIPTPEDQITYMTPTEIISFINKEEGMKVLDPNMSIRRLGSAMQKHGFRKKTMGPQKPYVLKKK